MTQTIRRLGVIATLLAATGCLSAPDDADSPDLAARVEPLGATTTVTTRVGFICNEGSASGSFMVDATIPSFVAPGEAFPVTIGLRYVPPILAVESGVLDLTATFKAVRASPATATTAFDPVVFAARAAVEHVGPETLNLTAAAQVGQPIKLRFPTVDSTVTWATRAPTIMHCTVAESNSPLIATIPIVLEPQSKADCKNGGYASHTDDTGKVFKNQGQCMRYVGGN